MRICPRKLPLWLDALQWQARAAPYMHAKEPAWADTLLKTQDDTTEAFRLAISELTAETERAWAHKLVASLTLPSAPSPLTAGPATDITRHLLHQSVRFMEQEDHAHSLSYLLEAQKAAAAIGLHLTEGGPVLEHFAPEILELQGEVEELQQDIERHLSICESTKVRVQADQQLSDCMLGDDSLDMDIVWQAVDSFKYAVVLTRELDIESEARALSRLAMLYLQVIKDEEKASHYTKRSVVLALSLYPVPVHMPWYQDVIRELQKMQNAATQRHQEEWHRKRQPILEALKDELQALRKASEQGTHKLIAHLYKHHAPQDPTHKEPSCDADNIKKAVLTAIKHYHPDKSMKEPDQRYVLHEEIIKLLNEKHSIFKGM
ncbi:hypothetical protein WJX73_006927 [Symbiochloris irregularis]|uniref:J domain-containing protein n=1 Tax=Symbiochloris irregularis TaxID=706552 RepID=A0AAW1NMC1_9CHLO